MPDTPVERITLFQWASKTYCFDFSPEGALQGPTPGTLTTPVVEYIESPAPVNAPTIGTPVVITEDFYNDKGVEPKKVAGGKGIAVRFTAGGTVVPGDYPVKCTAIVDGDLLTVAGILVVSEDPD